MRLRGLLALIAIAFSVSVSVSAQDSGIPDSLRHGCDVIYYEHSANDTFLFPLYLYSDDSLETITVVICHNSESVEFLEARPGPSFDENAWSTFLVTDNSAENSLSITWIGTSSVLPPLNRSEVFATLKFISYSACPWDFEIDTCSIFPVGSTHFVSPGRQSYSPVVWNGIAGALCRIVSCVGVDDEWEESDQIFSVFSVHPNPLTVSTSVRFSSRSRQFIMVDICNVLGERVRTLFAGIVDIGETEFLWDAQDGHGNEMASGLYFARIQTADCNQVRKLLLLR